MSEKLWSECSPAERDEITKLEKRIRKLKKYISLGYLTEKGKEYFTKELLKDVNRVERKYKDGSPGKSV